MFRGALLAVSQIADDESFGFSFDAQSYDPQGVNENYVSGAKQLLGCKGLTHVVGCYTSSSRKEVLPVFEKRDALLWYPSHYEGFETSENIVYTGAAPNQHVVPLTHYLLAQGARNAFMIGSNYIWAWENNRIMRDMLGRNGGQVLGERYVPVGDCDFDELIDLVLRCRPDFIFNTLIGVSAYEFFRRFRSRCVEAGLNQVIDIPIVSCSLAEPELSLIGAASDGHLSSSVYFSSIQSAENERFLAAWKAAYPSVGEPSADAEATYIAVHMLAHAIRMAQSSAVPDVLASLTDVRFHAPQGPVKINPENRHSYLWPRIGRSRSDGTFEIIHESSAVVGPDPYLVWEPLTMSQAPRQGLKVVS